MVVSENNYSSIRKKDTNVRKLDIIQSMSNNSILRSIANHRHSHLGVGHHTTHHVARNVTTQRHSHVGVNPQTTHHVARNVARHRHSHVGVNPQTTHHVARNVTRQRHSHVGFLSEYDNISLRGGASRAYVDERVAALLAMVVDLQAQIGGGGGV